MKHATRLLYFIVAVSLGAAERDAPDFRAFPNPGHDWTVIDGRQLDDGQYSWRHYKHEKTGDVVACVAWHTHGLSIEHSPVRQASTETITSNGYAFALTQKLGQPIADTIRHQAVTIDAQNHSANRKASHRAIEYTYVYESANGESTPAMAHGYVIVVEDFAIFVQHTANRVITSDIAQGLAKELCITCSAKQTSIPTGWSAYITRSDK